MNYRVSKKGFTLIELLIVISIIGILAVALLPNVLNAPIRARDAARKSDIATIVKAVETYNVDNGGYPSGQICFNGVALAAPLEKLNTYFSGSLPPKDPGDATRAIIGGCNGGYVYCKKNGSPFSYLIISKMEGKEANKHDTPDINSCDGTAAGTVAPGALFHVVAQ
jgi:type II secretion system protein G